MGAGGETSARQLVSIR